MEVETLGVARSLGWKVHMRCTDGCEEHQVHAAMLYRKQLDLETLVSTTRPELPVVAAGVAADVPGLRKSPGNGRVRTTDQYQLRGG